jgi:hypothetical protein
LLAQRSQLPPLQEVLGCLDLLSDIVIELKTYGLHEEGVSCLSLLLSTGADHVLEHVITLLGAFEKQASDHLGVEVNFVDFLGYSVQDKVEKERNDDRFENGRGQLGLADLGQLESVAQLEAGVEEDALGVLCPGFAVVSGDAVALALTASFSGCWSWSLSLGRPDAVKVQTLFDLCVIRLHELLHPKIERLVNLQSINSELILINNK